MNKAILLVSKISSTFLWGNLGFSLSGTLPGVIVCEHSSPLHPHVQVKAPSGREEATCERDPETPPSSLDRSSLKMD